MGPVGLGGAVHDPDRSALLGEGSRQRLILPHLGATRAGFSFSAPTSAFALPDNGRRYRCKHLPHRAGAVRRDILLGHALTEKRLGLLTVERIAHWREGGGGP